MTNAFDNSELVEIRDFISDDRPFIKATWLKGLRYGNDWFRLIDSKAYFKVYGEMLERLLDDPSTQVRIACLKEGKDVILGYSVSKGNTLHWVQVKENWRNIGIAKRLVPSTTDTVTHLTKVGLCIFKKHRNIIFNPFT